LGVVPKIDLYDEERPRELVGILLIKFTVVANA
jgi:hypothetical protein